MTLTLANGPLAAGAPDTVNYKIDGPQHKILFSPFPRRIRAVVAGQTLIDTDEAMLLHESNILPALYVPVADVRFDLLTKTDHTTHCPFKGDASYWTINVGDDSRGNAVWGYENPLDEATWLGGYVAVYWHLIDEWFDEDEQVFGHLCDPYHRVDIRPTGRRVKVSVAGQVVADTTSAKVLSETGIKNRYYIPAEDVARDLFTLSSTTTHCPYKGDTSYWSYAGETAADDIAWSYPAPFDESLRIADHWSFDGDDISIEVG